MKFKYRNRLFWCRVYYVDMVGKNAIAIKQYIDNQLKEDRMSEQLTLDKVAHLWVAENETTTGESCFALLSVARTKSLIGDQRKTTSYASGYFFIRQYPYIPCINI